MSFLDDYENLNNISMHTIELLKQVFDKNGHELATIRDRFNLMEIASIKSSNALSVSKYECQVEV
jgi:hypothetical protein